MPALQIFAAGSLRPAFDRLAETSPQPLQLTYANARDLAERIVAGQRADVFASASEEHPLMLRRAGLAGSPRPIAVNRLVVAVAQDSPASDPEVLAAPGIRIVIEVAGIPLGDYTRELLARMENLTGPGFTERALANVVSEEVVVDAVAARVLAGEADAAVLYATDVLARAPQLRAIEIPDGAGVAATYAACVVAVTDQPDRAHAWLDDLAAPATRAIFRRAGFGPPPRGDG